MATTTTTTTTEAHPRKRVRIEDPAVAEARKDQCLLIAPQEDPTVELYWVPCHLVTQEAIKAHQNPTHETINVFLVDDDDDYTPDEKEELRSQLPDALKPWWGNVHRLPDDVSLGATVAGGWGLIMFVANWF